jgi:hypothetical protein
MPTQRPIDHGEALERKLMAILPMRFSTNDITVARYGLHLFNHGYSYSSLAFMALGCRPKIHFRRQCRKIIVDVPQ